MQVELKMMLSWLIITYIHIHTYMHTYVSIYIHTLTTHIHRYTHTYINTRTHTYTHTYTHTRIHKHIHANKDHHRLGVASSAGGVDVGAHVACLERVTPRVNLRCRHRLRNLCQRTPWHYLRVCVCVCVCARARARACVNLNSSLVCELRGIFSRPV